MKAEPLRAEHLSPDHLNIAYDEAMTWGPRLGQALIPRLQERIANLSLEMAAALEREVRAAQNLANMLCEQAYANELTRDQVRVALLERFSWIDEANFSHAFSQGMYYAWHG
jgi:hypothetical protein